MSEFTDLQQVWLVVSPHNPLKEKKELSDSRKRLAAVKKAVGKNPKIKVSDVEFSLHQPSYTIDTLEVIKKKYPQHIFVLIIGSDNLSTFHKWKKYEKILGEHRIYVYPRFSSSEKELVARRIRNHPNIKMVDAPRIDISSTFIRKQLKKGRDVRYFVP